MCTTPWLGPKRPLTLTQLELWGSVIVAEASVFRRATDFVSRA
jgi:hypothetical protein